MFAPIPRRGSVSISRSSSKDPKQVISGTLTSRLQRSHGQRSVGNLASAASDTHFRRNGSPERWSCSAFSQNSWPTHIQRPTHRQSNAHQEKTAFLFVELRAQKRKRLLVAHKSCFVFGSFTAYSRNRPSRDQLVGYAGSPGFSRSSSAAVPLAEDCRYISELQSHKSNCPDHKITYPSAASKSGLRPHGSSALDSGQP